MAKGGGNKSFVLRVDAATMEALEQWADDEFRSINGQLRWIIADALRRSGRLKKSAAAAADATAGADADKDMSSVVDETAAKE
ncbi:MAG TPA: DNA-binding protein [Candidatus Alistipes merdipullorum]|nr:DNA-binding protein [Candidatus Alistipes merdipullorum]